MGRLDFFDCHAEYGPRRGKHLLERFTLDHLLADLDLAEIAGALVRHSQQRYYDAMLVNRRLCREIADQRHRLFPVWAFLPPLVGEFPAPADFLAELRDHGVRAVTMFPAACQIEPAAELLWPWAELLAAERLPLLLSWTELGGVERADAYLDLLAGVAVILTDASWGNWRQVHWLMSRHANLHLECSSFQADRAVEVFGRLFGHQRLLFGTNLPHKAPGAARGMLDWSLDGQEEAQAVASGNLRRLLGGVGPAQPAATTPWDDALTAAARAGEPVPCHLLNAHCHVLEPGGQWAGEANMQPGGDAASMLALSQRIGVDGTALMSWNGTVGMDMADGNRVVAEAIAVAPEHYLGLVTIDPTHMSADEMAAAIQRYHLELGFRGLKHDLATTLPMNHPQFEPWWRFGAEHRLYALFDQPAHLLPPILDVARRHPDLHVLVAHCGRGYGYAAEVVAMHRQAGNVHCELTYTAVPNGLVEWLVEEVGAEHVIWGTDSPMRDPRPQLGWVVWTRLPLAAKLQILGGNFRRVLAAGRLPGLALPMSFRQPPAGKLG